MAYDKEGNKTESSDESQELSSWHQKVLKNFDVAYSGCQQVREDIREAMRFVRVPGAQWEGSTNAGFEIDDRFDKYPRFELNKVAKECDRIIGEYRKNRITVRFRPNDGDASEELAGKLNGKFRADFEESSGGEALDNGFDDSVAGGMGCIRLDTCYEDELDPMNEAQRIIFEPVYDSASSVFFDPNSKKYDRSDALWAIEIFGMSPEAFADAYPDADKSSLDVDVSDNQFDWSPPEYVYIGRYFEVKVEQTTLQVWRNPLTEEIAVYDEEEIEDISDELIEGGFEKIEGKDRKVKRRRVYCGLLSGTQWLEEPKRIAGSFIPLIPIYGKRWFVDGMERIEGHAAKAMDAQRLENLMVSMVADNATQSSGDNIPIVDIDMIPGALANSWGERNIKRPAFLPMTSMKDKSGNIVAPASVLGYTQPTPLSPAVAALLQYTGNTIQQITGSNQLENMPSNIATDTVDTIFNRMDVQSFIYMDNLAKSLKHAGKVWLSMAREVYGSESEVRVIMEDGTDDLVLLTGSVKDRQSGKEVALNDISIGTYQVVADVGQSFSTRRDATVRQLTTIIQGIPPNHPYYSIIMGMIIDNMDGEGIDDLKDYNREQMLMSGAVKPRTAEEKAKVAEANQAKQGQQDPMMVQAQAQMMLAQAEAEKAKADTIDAQTKAASVQVDMLNAETKRMEAMIKAQEAGVKIDNIQADTASKRIDNIKKVL